MNKVLLVFGTRPEAIKLCPVAVALREGYPQITTKICVTAQHRLLLDQVLRVFAVEPDYDLNCMQSGQSLAQLTARAISALEPVFETERPDFVIVQGDTTTTFCGALAAFYARIPVAHVEAGLRTGDVEHPFPEELNRVLTARLTSLHFAPTAAAAENLRAEGVAPDAILVTGNTAIDAVLYVRDGLRKGRWPHADLPLDSRRKLILVTAHRRESFGARLEEICRAIACLAERPDVQIVYPVHPNPNVRRAAGAWLEGLPNVILIEPLDYIRFVSLLMRAHFVLTDSGGIQEEAPALGKPALVMREKTERPEGIEAGSARLIGGRRDRILAECARLLDDPEAYQAMAEVRKPYGSGTASRQIAHAIVSKLAER